MECNRIKQCECSTTGDALSSVALEVKSLKKQFGGNKAVNGTSFTVEAGSITGIIGPNGAGKTTCFNCIAGELRPDEGKVIFQGDDVTRRKPYLLYRKGLHRTFQIPGPIEEMSVIENLMMPISNQLGEKLWGALFTPFRVKREEVKNFSLAWDVLKLINMEKLAFERAKNLSGGQKKLLELARALMDSPQMLLLDEPTAGVNPSLARELGKHLQNIAQQMNLTLLLISHDMALVRRICEHVIVMANGAVLTQGSAEEVSSNRDVQKAYLGRA